MYISEIWWIFVVLALGSYFFGNISFAIIISRLKKNDIRSLGSGNPGTMNMSRNFGAKIGALTLLLDVIKGVIPTIIGYFVFKGKFFSGTDFEIADFTKLLCAMFVVIGHIYPVLLKFKGGKGIATTFGVIVACNFYLGLITILAVILFIFLTELGSLGSLLGVTILGVFECNFLYSKYVLNGVLQIPFLLMLLCNLFILIICFLTWYAHRSNIVKLVKGIEHKTSVKKMFKKKKKEQI